MTTLLLQGGLEPLTLLTMRYTLSSLLFVGTLALTNHKLFVLPLKALLICLACGVLYCISAYTFTLALTQTSTSVATMLMAIYPLMVLVILMVRGEKLTLKNIVRIMLGLAGVYFLIGPGGYVKPLGVVFVLLSGFAYALYLALMQWYLKAQDPRTIIMYITLTITALFLAAWLWQGGTVPPLTLKGWGMIAVMVVGCTYIAQLTLLSAVRVLGSAQVAMLAPLDILLTLVWSLLLLGDTLSFLQWVGGGLILLSMLLAMFRLQELRRLWRVGTRLRL